eukprot:CAMPEP_0174253822 /NCGR_PEP_ID=MMETSP0439-20130205/3176_1 /TAXON_ID=0 /ORGANISM="Stereomyxa ramosa, Strain Chinc5" /LENGTH=441 /DNA_ID=CAMNT_0015335067 /DNA_START=118 /DNA_END=1439 /DNA_ORIENTATION=+
MSTAYNPETVPKSNKENFYPLENQVMPAHLYRSAPRQHQGYCGEENGRGLSMYKDGYNTQTPERLTKSSSTILPDKVFSLDTRKRKREEVQVPGSPQKHFTPRLESSNGHAMSNSENASPRQSEPSSRNLVDHRQTQTHTTNNIHVDVLPQQRQQATKPQHHHLNHYPHMHTSTFYGSLNADSHISQKKRRGSYKCGKCGKPKRGHFCTAPRDVKDEFYDQTNTEMENLKIENSELRQENEVLRKKLEKAEKAIELANTQKQNQNNTRCASYPLVTIGEHTDNSNSNSGSPFEDSGAQSSPPCLQSCDSPINGRYGTDAMRIATAHSRQSEPNYAPHINMCPKPTENYLYSNGGGTSQIGVPTDLDTSHFIFRMPNLLGERPLADESGNRFIGERSAFNSVLPEFLTLERPSPTYPPPSNSFGKMQNGTPVRSLVANEQMA